MGLVLVVASVYQFTTPGVAAALLAQSCKADAASRLLGIVMATPPERSQLFPVNDNTLPRHVPAPAELRQYGNIPYWHMNVPAVPFTLCVPVQGGPLPHLHTPLTQVLPLTHGGEQPGTCIQAHHGQALAVGTASN